LTCTAAPPGRSEFVEEPRDVAYKPGIAWRLATAETGRVFAGVLESDGSPVEGPLELGKPLERA
jgi:hypothetical protein